MELLEAHNLKDNLPHACEEWSIAEDKFSATRLHPGTLSILYHANCDDTRMWSFYERLLLGSGSQGAVTNINMRLHRIFIYLNVYNKASYQGPKEPGKLRSFV